MEPAHLPAVGCAVMMMRGTHGLPERQIFGMPIAAVMPRDVIDCVERAIDRRERLHIGVVNAAKIVNMRRDELLRRDVLASDIILADGMSVVWASRLLGQPLPTRVTGIDLMFDMLSLANRRRYRVFCLGATAEVLATVTATLRRDYPDAELVGARDGYFALSEIPAVMDEVAQARPDILLVAMTSPKKEQFLAQAQAELAIPVLHGVGGSFDVMAGKVKRAPEMWQRLGLEWLYRVKQEPRRLWRRYFITNTLFCSLVLQEMIRRLFRLQSSVTTG
jgi:N-acetylglucosaminyldiphosphoundecaprenol N-acetyl-beta-D-mannosaminyltransferase